MARARVYRTDAVILRRANTGETDRILTIFTPTLGKLRVVAKGVRKVTSRKSGHVELFMVTDMLIARGRTLDVVTQAETLQIFRAIREDLEKTSSAYYMAELLDSFTEEGDSQKPLFDLFIFALTTLNHTDSPYLILRYFELQLLGLTGFQPQLHFCVASNQPLQPVDNYFSFVDGGVIMPEYGQLNQHTKLIPASVLKVLRFIQTQPWEIIASLQLTLETKNHVEAILLGYITYTLERRLKSVNFINKLRNRG